MTDSPSLKFDRMGSSMMSPEGLAMRPRMPASCRIWLRDPRAPEWAIMYTGLNPSLSFFSSSMSSLVTSSLVELHTSMTLL